MPIILTTPFDPGDTDPGQTYAAVQIVSMRWALSGYVEVECQHGNVVAGAWVPGSKPTTWHSIADNPKTGDKDYSAIVTTKPLEGESVYAGAGRGLYEHLVAKGIYPGTVV